MEWLVTASGLLALLSGLIGIMSTVRSHRLAQDKLALERQQAGNSRRTSLIDDIQQVLDTMKEENGRLTTRVEELETANKSLAKANDHLAGRIEELEMANGTLVEANAHLTKRVEELEADLKRLEHLKSNL